MHLRAGVAVRDRDGRIFAARRLSTTSCRSTGSASATSWTAIQQKIAAMEDQTYKMLVPARQRQEEERREQQEQAQAAAKKSKKRTSRAGDAAAGGAAAAGGDPRSTDSRREHADRRLHLCAPELALPDAADVVVHSVPGVLHAELARPHQSQLPAILPRRGSSGRGAQPAGDRRHGARLRGGQLPAGPAAGGDQLGAVLDDAPAVSRCWWVR